jgi:hypothetical protein
MAEGRPADAAREIARAREILPAEYATDHPRRAMLRCALGAALGRLKRDGEAKAELAAGCPGMLRWGLADPSVAAWARAEAARLDVHLEGSMAR